MEPTLDEIITALESAQPMGAATDTPEGSRYVQMGTTVLGSLVSGLKTHRTEHTGLKTQLEDTHNASLVASRGALVDKLLASEEWQSGEEDMDAEFKADALQIALKAETDDAAETAVLKMTAKQSKLLGLAKNTPGLETGDPFGKKKATNEQTQAITQARRDSGLWN